MDDKELNSFIHMFRRHLDRTKEDTRTLTNRIRGLSGKYPSILNISRTGHVALM